jgi:hypothetical protein
VTLAASAEVVAGGERCSYDEERGTGHTPEAAIMTADKKDGRARPKRNRGGSAHQAGGVTVVDIDPWGSFFEKFWEQAAESESGDGHAGEQKPAEAMGRPTRPGKRGRSSRTS